MRKKKVIASCALASILTVGFPLSMPTVNAASSTITVSANQSINDAIESASDGATIIVKGTHREQISIERNNLTIIGDGATLDGSNFTNSQIKNDSTMVYVKGSNIQIQGLNITGLKYKGSPSDTTPIGIEVEAGSKNISIRNCNVHDMGVSYQKKSTKYNAHGILVSGSDKAPITNVNVSGCSLYNLSLGNSEALVVNGNVDGFEIANNNIYNCDNIGIDAIGYEQSGKESDRARNGKIHDNRVTKISSDPAVNLTYTCKCADGIYVDGGKDIDIYNNYVENCDIGIEISSEHKGKTTSGIKVYNNNLVNNNAYAGFCIGGASKSENGYAKNCSFTNNTVVNAEGNCVVVQYACDASNKIANNIFVAEKPARAYSEALGKYSQGNTVSGNKSNEQLPSGTGNEVIDVNGWSIDSSAKTVTIDTDASLRGVGSDKTVGGAANAGSNNGDESDDTDDVVSSEPTAKIECKSSYFKCTQTGDTTAKISYTKGAGEDWHHINVNFSNVDLSKYSKVYITVVPARNGMNFGITNQDEKNPIFYRNHWRSAGIFTSTNVQTVAVDLTEENVNGLYLYCDPTSNDTPSGEQTLMIKSIYFE